MHYHAKEEQRERELTLIRERLEQERRATEAEARLSAEQQGFNLGNFFSRFIKGEADYIFGRFTTEIDRSQTDAIPSVLSIPFEVTR